MAKYSQHETVELHVDTNKTKFFKPLIYSFLCDRLASYMYKMKQYNARLRLLNSHDKNT